MYSYKSRLILAFIMLVIKTQLTYSQSYSKSDLQSLSNVYDVYVGNDPNGLKVGDLIYQGKEEEICADEGRVINIKFKVSGDAISVQPGGIAFSGPSCPTYDEHGQRETPKEPDICKKYTGKIFLKTMPKAGSSKSSKFTATATGYWTVCSKATGKGGGSGSGGTVTIASADDDGKVYFNEKKKIQFNVHGLLLELGVPAGGLLLCPDAKVAVPVVKSYPSGGKVIWLVDKKDQSYLSVSGTNQKATLKIATYDPGRVVTVYAIYQKGGASYKVPFKVQHRDPPTLTDVPSKICGGCSANVEAISNNKAYPLSWNVSSPKNGDIVEFAKSKASTLNILSAEELASDDKATIYVKDTYGCQDSSSVAIKEYRRGQFKTKVSSSPSIAKGKDKIKTTTGVVGIDPNKAKAVGPKTQKKVFTLKYTPNKKKDQCKSKVNVNQGFDASLVANAKVFVPLLAKPWVKATASIVIAVSCTHPDLKEPFLAVVADADGYGTNKTFGIEGSIAKLKEANLKIDWDAAQKGSPLSNIKHGTALFMKTIENHPPNKNISQKITFNHILFYEIEVSAPWLGKGPPGPGPIIIPQKVSTKVSWNMEVLSSTNQPIYSFTSFCKDTK